MNNWRVQPRLLFLAGLPLLLVSLILAALAAWYQVNSIQNTLDRHGNAVASYLAPASEYSLFSGNYVALDGLVRGLTHDHGVMWAKIINNQGDVVSESLGKQASGAEPLVFAVDVFLADGGMLLGNDLQDDPLAAEAGGQFEPLRLGRVEVALDNSQVRHEKVKVVITCFAVAGGVLLLTLPLVAFITRSISRPLAHMTEFVGHIQRGDLSRQVVGHTGGELAELQDGINQMAYSLKIATEEIGNRYKTLFDYSGDAVFLLRGGVIVDCNERAEALLQVTQEAVLGARLSDYIASDYCDDASLVDFDAELQRALAGDGRAFDVRFMSEQQALVDAEVMLVATEINRTVHLIVFVRDVTERKQAQQKLEFQANFDAVTGLPNRVLANDRLSQAIEAARRDQHHVAVLFIDVDRFKNVNDTMGHLAGDRLLMSIGQRLNNLISASDTVARLGGDEFLIVLASAEHEQDAARVAEKITHELARPFELEGRTVYLGASVGIALYPEDGADGETLLRNADAAMYKAKYDGRSTYRYFTAEIGQQAEYWVEAEHGLKQGLAREEFSLVYQPQVNPQSGETEVVEVLLRWNSARLGQVPPGRFIPIAEEAGSIIEIGDWVLERLCQHINVIGAQSPDNLRYAVNVSGRQLKDPEFVRRALAILEKYRVPAARIEFELTESILIEHEVSVEALQQIKAHGIRLSLDDFGVGYSSLSYLSRYPFDTLKIDRSFVRNINHVDGGATNLCDMIIGIANRLGLQIVAEGVESEGQYEFLRSHGVHLLQGFFLCEPLPKEAMMGFVQRSLPD